MTNIVQSSTVNVTNPRGAQIVLTYVLTNADGSLYNISAAAFEYVVRLGSADTSTTPLIKLTTGATSQGVLTVNTGASSVTVTVYPAATLASPPGLYTHALWMNAGTTGAIVWLRGQFLTQGVAQP